MAIFDNLLSGIKTQSATVPTTPSGALSAIQGAYSNAMPQLPAAGQRALTDAMSHAQNAFSNPSPEMTNFMKSLGNDPLTMRAVDAFGGSLNPSQEQFLAAQHAFQSSLGNVTQPYDVWRQQTGVPTMLAAHLQIPNELHPTIYTPGQMQLIGAVNNAIA